VKTLPHLALIKGETKMGIIDIKDKDTTVFTLPKLTIPSPQQLLPFKIGNRPQANQFSRSGYRNQDTLSDGIAGSSGFTPTSAYSGTLQAKAGSDFGNRYVTLKPPYTSRYSVETTRFDRNSNRTSTTVQSFTLPAGSMKTFRMNYPVQKMVINFNGRA
jgi:hypothetical protein